MATVSQFASRPSRISRPAGTVPLHCLNEEEQALLLMRMEEEQRREIGERITQLRERSPFTQPDVAGKLGIGLRAYQKLERTGTTKYERCEELAKIHAEWTRDSTDWQHVSADWIWDGRMPRSEAPDLMGSLNGERTQLDRIEALLLDIRERLRPDEEDQRGRRRRRA